MSRSTILAGYGLLAFGLVACQVVALRTGRLPTIGQLVSLVTRWRLVRWLLLAAWLWVGWHVFARSS